jgi:hypothetical protein
VKLIYAEMLKLYPDLVEIAKDKGKRKLKPLVLYKSDFDSLEAEMVKNYGCDNSHVPIVWKLNDSQLHDDTFTDGIPAKDRDHDDGEDPEEEDDPKEKKPPAKSDPKKK